MSIKIYNGYILPKMSIDQLSKFCLKIKEDLAPIKLQEVTKEMTETAVEELDSRVFHPTKSKEMPLYHAFEDMQRRIKKVKTDGLRDPAIDFESYAIFFPKKDHILALFISENTEMNKYWKNLKGVKEYHYQNSTDRPDEIDAKEWSKRKRAWRFLNNGKYQGFSFHFTDMDLYMEWGRIEEKDIMSSIPSWDSRVKSRAKTNLIDKLMKKEEKFSWPWYMRTTRWIAEDPKGQKALEDAKKKVSDRMVKNVKMKDLVSRWKGEDL